MRSVASSALFLAVLVISACAGGPGAPAATGAPAPAAATTKAFQGTKDFTVAFSPIGVSSQSYVKLKKFDVNGGLTEENIKGTIDFFVTGEAVKPGLTVKDVTDLSYLEAVLSEIGRK